MAARVAVSALLFMTLVVMHCTDQSAEMTVRWQDPATEKVGYRIERQEGEKGEFREIATTPPDVTSFTDSDVVTGRLYCYRVGAVQTTGEVAYLDKTCRTADQADDEWTP
jgi:fibronectin type 3 domain-containing protein